MTSASRTIGLPIAAHAVCVAAGVRDGLRAAHFYVRDLANADRFGEGRPDRVPLVSRAVAQGARAVDRLIECGARATIAMFLPSWRTLPSPFKPGLMHEVAKGIREDSLVHNPLFNAYFFRAAIHIARRYSTPPYLILEHRIDAARRNLALRQEEPTSANAMLARILIALVEQGPVARIGKVADRNRFFAQVEPNIAVNTIACVALMFAEEGKPSAAIEEDEFFSVTGALIGPRLLPLSDLIANRDEPGLARALEEIKSLY